MPQRILFVTSTRIGDAVLSTGLLSHLVETRPEARFTIACGRVTASLFAGVPRLERILPITKGKYAKHWFKLWAATVPHRWDTVVDLRRSALPWMLCAGTRVRPGMPDPDAHRVVSNAQAVGVDPPPAPRLWALERHRMRGAELIPPGGPVLAVGPTANWAGKTWPVARFVDLVRRLTAPGAPFADARVAVFSAPGEAAATQPLLEALAPERRIAVTGEADLLNVYAALARCDFYIGNDSGLMHMAAAGGVPTLGLFGPSRDDVYGPWGANCASVRTPLSLYELTAAPDYDHRTTGTLMDGLTVDAVEAAALSLWSNRR